MSISGIQLNWEDNADNEDNYILESAPEIQGNFSKLKTLSADETNYIHTGLEEGQTVFYSVKATNSAGDSDYSDVVSATTSITGLEDELKDRYLIVFPNPMDKELFLTLDNEYYGQVIVKLINLQGIVITESSFNKASQKFGAELSTLSIPQGTYVLEVIFGKDRIVRLLNKLNH